MSNKITLKECIIVNTKIGKDIILAKNRDRNYQPNLSIIREVIDGIELVYMFDSRTGWKEGMNSNGLGIVNTALFVEEDEKAHNIPKKKITMKDGDIMYKALQGKTIEEAVTIISDFKNGLKGHTIVANKEEIFTIECDQNNSPFTQQKSITDSNVFTNHGEYYANAGYTDGDDYISSVLRQAQVRKKLKAVKSESDIFKILSNSVFNENNPNHVFRNTDNMKTTSQLLMNLTDFHFIFKPVLSTLQKFNGIINKTPKNYTPKIKITIVNED